MRKPGRGMNHNQDQCTTQGTGIEKGCEVIVTCDSGYYPAFERYLVPGKQILKCAKDGSGWVDQFGILVKDAVHCKKGCVKRDPGFGSVAIDRTSIEQTYNFIFGDKVVQIYCSYSKENRRRSNDLHVFRIDFEKCRHLLFGRRAWILLQEQIGRGKSFVVEERHHFPV